MKGYNSRRPPHSPVIISMNSAKGNNEESLSENVSIADGI
jgi:hypothetical protein